MPIHRHVGAGSRQLDYWRGQTYAYMGDRADAQIALWVPRQRDPAPKGSAYAQWDASHLEREANASDRASHGTKRESVRGSANDGAFSNFVSLFKGNQIVMISGTFLVLSET